METFYHPLHKVWHSQDGAETSVVVGEWTSNKRNNKQRAERKQLVNVVRWVGGWMGGWVDVQVDGWMDGWMDGWVDGWTLDRREDEVRSKLL